MKRRRFITSLAALGLGPLLIGTARVFALPGGISIPELQARWQKLVPAGATIAGDTTPIGRADEEWRTRLPKDAYRVLFEEGTEPPFSSALNDEKRSGVFVCRACDLPLFSSEMKYDSRTGWPSFFTNIPEHLATKTDYKIIWPRTEYHCVKCGGHQGHIFDDGPPPTNKRWCNNGVALRFIPSE